MLFLSSWKRRKREAVWIDKDTSGKCGNLLPGYDALGVVGGGVQEAIDDLKNAEYQDGPFENNLESAQAYLLTQLQEKYGIEFTVVGDEDLENYGLFAGATYICSAMLRRSMRRNR